MTSEQEVRMLLSQLQQSEAEAHAYEQQMELVSFTLSDIEHAVVAVEALSKPEIGKSVHLEALHAGQ